MTEFDQLAEHYDLTRGGERRGDEYAVLVDQYLPPGPPDGPILEVGTGTGVVALGLRRLGRPAVAFDLSPPMLARARQRLGSSVARMDAMRMALADASVAHAVGVWIVQSVPDPVRLFEEAARVLRPGGRFVVAQTQRWAPDDVVGAIVTEMTIRVDERRGASRPRGVTTEEVLDWAGRAGFAGTVHPHERSWPSTVAEELASIAHRQWPAMRELDEAAIDEVTRPAIVALQALDDEPLVRRGTVDVVVLSRSLSG